MDRTGSASGDGKEKKRKKETVSPFRIPITPCAPLDRTSLVNIKRRLGDEPGDEPARMLLIDCLQSVGRQIISFRP